MTRGAAVATLKRRCRGAALLVGLVLAAMPVRAQDTLGTDDPERHDRLPDHIVDLYLQGVAR